MVKVIEHLNAGSHNIWSPGATNNLTRGSRTLGRVAPALLRKLLGGIRGYIAIYIPTEGPSSLIEKLIRVTCALRCRKGGDHMGKWRR